MANNTPQDAFRPWRPHPWHGLDVGRSPPFFLNAYIEITPFDLVKYEVDKHSGYTVVDRPQQGSSHPPALYGFVPRTLCADRVRDLAPGATQGDMDPLDICVISERPINRGDVILRTRVIGGLQLIDNGEADDKIIAVLEGDLVWGDATDLTGVPDALIQRLCHYFSTYKIGPDAENVIEITKTYGPPHAAQVIIAAMTDYLDAWGRFPESYTG